MVCKHYCNKNNQLEPFSNHPDHFRKPGTAALTVTERIRSCLDLAHIKKPSLSLYSGLSQFSGINEFSQILVCPCLLSLLLNQLQVIMIMKKTTTQKGPKTQASKTAKPKKGSWQKAKSKERMILLLLSKSLP